MEPFLLQTKLYAPAYRPNLVSRPRLIEKINQARPLKLVLISAAAGYGKTTLTTEWLASQPAETPVCWFSLDAEDSDPAQFFRYLAAAVRPLPGLGNMLQEQLGAPVPAKVLMGALVNDLTTVSDPFLLVLDDYHVLDSPEIDEALSFLLDYMPPQMTLVITTREDPPFSLARLRARRQMVEVRANDLRFRPAESAELFNQMLGLSLTEAEITGLEARTEGWIAGLQLAALSMQGRADTAAFIEAFSGGHQFILDYLIEEVLEQQPPAVRRFLLHTSVLQDLSGSLCDAVTGQENGRDTLIALEKSNLFVISLDDQRQWYRYHHLFAEVLGSRLTEEASAEEISEIHRRASGWYEAQSRPNDAIRHALTASDFERAARLLERVWRSMDRAFQTRKWHSWVTQLPEEIIRRQPVLSAATGWSYLAGGQIDEAEVWLSAAEQVDPAAQIVHDEAEFKVLPVTIASARAYLAQAIGDFEATAKYAQQALDGLPEEDALGRAIPAAILGLAQWANGELAAADQALVQSMDSFLQSGNPLLAVSGTVGISDVRIGQGRWHAAIQACEESLAVIEANGEPPLRAKTDLLLQLSEIYRELGESETAEKYFIESDAVGDSAASPQWGCRRALAKARLSLDEGNVEDALSWLDEGEKLFVVNSPLPNFTPIPTLRAAIWIAQGKLPKAKAWAADRGLSFETPPTFLTELDHLTFARLHLDQPEVQPFLDRMLAAAEAQERRGSVLKISILKALAYEAGNDRSAAIEALGRALVLGHAEGVVRQFVDEGDPMRKLLEAARAKRIEPEYCQRLLDGLQTGGRVVQTLADPLTERELEVLRLLATKLSGPQIADRLSVSLNTMRTHTKNIYSKLNATSRDEAVEAAHTFGLI